LVSQFFAEQWSSLFCYVSHYIIFNLYYYFCFLVNFYGAAFYLQYPVYFAFEDDNIDNVLLDIKKNDASGQPATATTGG
jgi:hypothetical protein